MRAACTWPLSYCTQLLPTHGQPYRHFARSKQGLALEAWLNQTSLQHTLELRQGSARHMVITKGDQALKGTLHC